ncbi:MAG: HEPN domain-containing protein [Vicinamibacteria bacterium]
MLRRQPHDESTIELNGEWWLPDEADRRVAGVVRYDPTAAIQARFRGSLVSPESYYDRPNKPIDSILGLADVGAKCTLLRNWRSRPDFWVMTPEGKKTTSQFFEPELLVVGWHIPSSAHWRLEQVAVNYLHLEKWIGAQAFEPPRKLPLPDDEDLDNLIALDIKAPLESLRLPSLEAELTIKHEMLAEGDPFLQLDLRHRAWIELQARGRDWFDWFYPKLLHLEGLLSLLVQQPIQARAARAFRESDDFEFSADLFWVPAVGMTPSRIDPQEIGFPLQEVRDILVHTIEEWFAKREVYDIPLQLYLQSFHHTGPTQTAALLGLMSAIEFLHRSTAGGEYLENSEEFDSVFQGILSSLPKGLDTGLRRSIEDRLRYANEYVLRKRMDTIRDSLVPSVQGMLGIGSKNFWKRVVDTRNFLTHYSEGKHIHPYEDRHFPFVVYILRRLLSLLLLRSLGIPDKTIEEGLKRSSSHWYLDA